MDYVVAVQAPAYPISDSQFATESAFAEHLKELRQRIGKQYKRVILLAPRIAESTYQQNKNHLGVLDRDRDQVELVCMQPAGSSVKDFWSVHLRPLIQNIERALQNAGVVQSGLAPDTYRPEMLIVSMVAWRKKVPVVYVVDIDFRRNTERNYKLGRWSFKSYLINRTIHDPLRYAQVWTASRVFPLVLLKSASMVADFGKGRPNVKNFYDTVHALSDVLTGDALDARLKFLDNDKRPLELVYFGRLVPYKGLDRAVEAVSLARQQGADVRLTLIGSGECEQQLKEQVARLNLQDAVTFKGAVRYGKELFDLLLQSDLAINTPLIEDTPRSAFDAMARALPIVAFDIGYFQDLANESGAVALARWPEPSSLAEVFAALSKDRAHVVRMAQKGIEFARRNTQTEWLETRTEWVSQVTRAVSA